MDKMKILIADDQTLMRDGLKTIIDLEDNMEVAGTAKTGRKLWNTASSLLRI